LLQPIEIETCLHGFVHFGQAIKHLHFVNFVKKVKDKTMQRLYEARTWFKSSKDISLLALQYVVSKINFSIFLNTFIGIIGSLKAKYFSYAEFQ
jgi:hypothetical protein